MQIQQYFACCWGDNYCRRLVHIFFNEKITFTLVAPIRQCSIDLGYITRKGKCARGLLIILFSPEAINLRRVRTGDVFSF